MTGPFPEFSQSPAELSLDPEMLARELAEELLGDPLDELEAPDADAAAVAAECDLGLQLLQALRIDSEPVVRSNSAWSLGRLYDDLVEPRQKEVVDALLGAMLQDNDPAVRDEARLALEQLEDPQVLERLQTLVDEGLLS